MGAGADWKRVRRLGRYLARDRRRLFVTLALLVPVALAGSIQPLLVGQAISVLRREPSLPWLSGLAVPQAIQTIVGLLLISVLLRLALQGIQTFNIQAVGQRLTARNSRRSFSPRPFAVPSFSRQHARGQVAHQVDQRC
jgi:ATP-binding cassette subfamily B protein